jgi:hypothetical protein
MGWDIHAFIEYSEWGETPFMKDFVICFGEVYIYRNYDLFRALGAPIGDNPHPLFPSRGIPHPMSVMARGKVEMRIVDEDEEEKFADTKCFFLTDQRSATSIRRKDADRLIETGKSKYLLDEEGKECKYHISNPDYKYPSWLLLSELKKALSSAGYETEHRSVRSFRLKPLKELPLEWELIISNMEWIEDKIGSGRTRLVYWFEY